VINSLKSWFGQVTTGHGVMILAGAFLSVLTGATSWPVALPFLAAGAIGLIWPENTALQSAGKAVATDVASVVAAFNARGAITALGMKPPV
jgi:hypothetical protein